MFLHIDSTLVVLATLYKKLSNNFATHIIVLSGNFTGRNVCQFDLAIFKKVAKVDNEMYSSLGIAPMIDILNVETFTLKFGDNYYFGRIQPYKCNTFFI